MTGFNLPPGCSVSDINRAFGDTEASPTSQKIYGHIEPIIDRLSGARMRRLSASLQAALDSSCDAIDSLSIDLDYAKRLLHVAESALPPDPPCHCREFSGTPPIVSGDECPRHAHTDGEPTLREEIASFLRPPQTEAQHTGEAKQSTASENQEAT